MSRYKVTITRTEYSIREFEVEAKNGNEAHETALIQAANHEWNRGNAEYEVEYIEKLETANTEAK